MVWPKNFVYFGTSEFSRIILLGLLKEGIKPLLVVSTLAKASGRGLIIKDAPVAQQAKKAGLNLITVKTLKTGLPAELTKTSAEFGLLAAFGKILPAELLHLYPLGIVNVHPSLLPYYRGASPIQSALLDGVSETGVTLIKLDEEVDHGPILAQSKIKVNEANAAELEKKLAQVALGMILQSIPLYLSGNITLKNQDHNLATYTRLIRKDDGLIHFNLPARVLNNKRRAFISWPGCWVNWQGKRLKLIETDVIESVNIIPGKVELLNGLIVIGCAQNSALIIKKLQLEGGKVLFIRDFLNGHPDFLGSQLAG